MAINPYKDTKTIKDYKSVQYTFAKESKAFQDWFKKTFCSKLPTAVSPKVKDHELGPYGLTPPNNIITSPRFLLSRLFSF